MQQEIVHKTDVRQACDLFSSLVNLRGVFCCGPAAMGWVEGCPPWPGGGPVASPRTNCQWQEAMVEATKQKDAQDSARNKTKDDALQEEGFAKFWSGVCPRKREPGEGTGK